MQVLRKQFALCLALKICLIVLKYHSLNISWLFSPPNRDRVNITVQLTNNSSTPHRELFKRWK